MADQIKQLTKVNQLRPLDSGLNLTVKVVNAKNVAQRGPNQARISECLVGDETGIIIFSARKDQGSQLSEFWDMSSLYSVLRPGPARRVDPEPEPVRVEYLDRTTKDPVKTRPTWQRPGRPGALTRLGQPVDLSKEGNTLVLTNAKVEMFKGSMRLAVDRLGRVEVGEPAGFTVDESNNLSLIEFERIDVMV
ncbi:nucleic acid-binding [Striga asiatica]|uniref:Nucleic acid-binding n=1 Tax=Striga asiatica TaxID=4170 RepID=A0A5A7PC70_STRAF|nr:nucleic acid-binding [Striga asiatica]